MIIDFVQPETQLILFKPTLEGRKEANSICFGERCCFVCRKFWVWRRLTVSASHSLKMTIQEKGTNSPPHLNTASRLLGTGASRTERELLTYGAPTQVPLQQCQRNSVFCN